MNLKPQHSQIVDVVLSRLIELPVGHLQIARETGVLKQNQTEPSFRLKPKLSGRI